MIINLLGKPQATNIPEEEIRMSIDLLHIEGTSEKLRRILRSHKIRSTFYTERTLRKLLCKPKDRVATVKCTLISFNTASLSNAYCDFKK